MPNTYTQLYVHIVFAVKGRQNIIPPQHKAELHKYITGIVQRRHYKLISINNMPDHMHIFVGMNPDMALSDLVRDVKAGSTNFINKEGWFKGRFCWQEGYGAFSYAHSQIAVVAQYIENQEKHHAKRSFKEEYLDMLKKFNVDFNEKYLFEWVDDTPAVAPDGASSFVHTFFYR
jgi:REP element-mobilizing transposase RayT